MSATELPIRSLEDLVAVMTARRIELGLSQIDIDDAAGLQGGYTGKIEAGIKNIGFKSLPGLLGALGLVLRCERASCSLDAETPVAWAEPAQVIKKKLRLRAAKGGRARWGESTPEERRKKMNRLALRSAKVRRARLNRTPNDS